MQKAEGVIEGVLTESTMEEKHCIEGRGLSSFDIRISVTTSFCSILISKQIDVLIHAFHWVFLARQNVSGAVAHFAACITGAETQTMNPGRPGRESNPCRKVTPLP